MRLSLRGSRETVTVDVEERSLRLLTVEGGKVQKWGHVLLEPGLVEKGLIRDPQPMAWAIKALFREQRAPKTAVISSLTMTGLDSTSTILNMPKIRPSLLENAIAREVKREMPVPVEELYLSHQIIGERGDTQQVYVLGVPRNLVDAHVKTFQAAGIKLKAMDLKPFALVRAVNRKDAIIADLEEDRFHVIVVVNAIPVIARDGPLGQEASDQEGKSRRLVEELNKTIEFYNRSHPANPLQASLPVFLTGALMGERSMRNSLARLIDHPIEVPEPPLDYPAHFPIAQYMVNIGLALKKGG